MSSDEMFFFNRNSIEQVYFIGFQDEEELNFRNEVLANLGELEVRDGAIVQKNE